ncbi:glucose 1-dehydrogenase [Paraburkholderia sp.]|uniref:glucose 1-dehydrogenase n=1 Tax=Paraburkholderia sp. TaxID=1926495 RepID=UPI003C7E1BCB
MTSSELFDLTGKVAVVTGGSRGLGYAMARALGHAGAKVAITARKQEELAAARKTLSDEGIEVLAVQNDIGKPGQSVALVDQVMNAFGKIDILVNNAGATWGAAAEAYPKEAWQKVVDVNLNGTWWLSQEVAVRSMIPSKRGVIINIASVAGLRARAPGEVPTVAYNVSKAAQNNLTQCLAAEWGKFGIRVNAIMPGWFPTKMTKGTLEGSAEKFNARTPLGRAGDLMSDLTGPILFLASDASSYVTGHLLAVDGGGSTVM